MPYAIVKSKAGGVDGYRVVRLGTPVRYMSKKAMTHEMAERQIRAIYAHSSK